MDKVFKNLNDCINMADLTENTLMQKKLKEIRRILIRKLEIEYEEFGGQLQRCIIASSWLL